MVDRSESYWRRALREAKAPRSLRRDVVVAMITGALMFLGLSVYAPDRPSLDTLAALIAGVSAFVIAFGGEYLYRLAQTIWTTSEPM